MLIKMLKKDTEKKQEEEEKIEPTPTSGF